ncbi:MAG TPA: hypothetical protein VG963_01385, partial [Polyangiaceae bacterium]|nr:hypothetical protein [Polyangiaceae bacterium]
SESLLRLGHTGVAREYFDWYAPYQFEDGKVPCCVDARGAGPVPENDSPGEFIHLAAELFRFSADRAELERAWPRVEAAARYLESLRREQRTRDAVDGQRPWSGLLPPSISHEGYSDKPAYSYWDDFWGLIGYQDATWLAEVSRHSEARERLARQRDEFKRDLLASLRASVAAHHIPFLPGAADRGDFDPTSTTIALEPGREGSALPHDMLLSTFERYWQEFVARRAGTRSWDVYTPYEMRIAGSFLRLGFPERAAELLSFFLEGRRPSAWNQWAEVVGRDARQPRFLGDLPHAWIASGFIRALLDRFAYAREQDDTLVIAAGVPASWLDTQAVRVTGLRTRYGLLDYSVTRNADHIILEVSGTASPARFAIPWSSVPGFWARGAAVAQAGKPRASIDGVPARWDNDELAFFKLPARVVIDRPQFSQ